MGWNKFWAVGFKGFLRADWLNGLILVLLSDAILMAMWVFHAINCWYIFLDICMELLFFFVAGGLCIIFFEQQYVEDAFMQNS